MKNFIRTGAAALLCVMIVLSTLLTVFSNFLSSTVLSQDFYLGIVATPTYITMVKDAINVKFAAQSMYVGIPEEVFSSMLDDGTLHLLLRNHIASAVNYLNGLTAFEKPVYPQELMTVPLYAYLEKQSALDGTVPTQAQYDQLDLVAADSAVIIQEEICLINLDLVKDRAAFQTVHQGLIHMRDAFVPALLTLLTSCLLLVLLYGRKWRIWLNGILVSLWISGTCLFVPTLVLHFFGLTNRLDIKTGYLKFFVDSVLTDMNYYFLLWGLLFFSVSSVTLIILKWTHHTAHKSYTPIYQSNAGNG